MTGASGTVGRAVLAALAGRGDVLAATRGPDAPGADERWFDLERPDSFAGAVAGVERLFLLLPPGLARAQAKFAALLAAARAAGVRHAVFLSIRKADRLTMLPHRGIERVIEASGLDWTHLRPNDFMQNFAVQPLYRDGVRRGVIRAPHGRSRTSFVDVRDVGAAAARVLTQDGHAQQAYPLTGPADLSLVDLAAIWTRVLGRPVEARAPSLLGFALHARRAGTRLPLALIMTSIGLVARLGYAKGVDPDLARLIGRPATPFDRFADDYRAAWEGGDPGSR